MRFTRIMMVVSAGALALLPACKKSEKKTDTAAAAAGGEAAKPAETPPTPPPATPPPEATPPAPMPPPAPEKPASVTDDDVATMDAVVVHMNALADAAAGAGDDCKKATAAMHAVNTKDKAVMTKAMALHKKMKADQAAHDWAKATYMPKMDDVKTKMMPVMQKCMTDKKFMAEMPKMDDDDKAEGGAAPAGGDEGKAPAKDAKPAKSK
jgi:hypothetical protein